MQARFLLGPAGSGKTFRCLAQIRAALAQSPDGPPLILLAPKQATFQLERQLLGWGERPREPLIRAGEGSPGVSPYQLSGYTRLRILSFERLAQFVLAESRVAPPRMLSEEGRVMVLRALLLQRGGELKRFDKSARRTGFAGQLSGLLAELQSHGLTPTALAALADRADLSAELQAKLSDLALLAQAYSDWLAGHGLQDANCLLDVATEALRAKPEVGSQKPDVSTPTSDLRPLTSDLRLLASDLWLDGFAEMTPAEVDLLAAVLPFCERATLAFCLDSEPRGEASWLSQWTVVGKSFLRCRERVGALPDTDVAVEILERDPSRSRFTHSPALAHLESHWSQPAAFTHPPPLGFGAASHASRITSDLPRLVACTHPDAEAAFAAREILKFARAGGRFREAAVLVRTLDGYQKPLERAFRHYGIPFFLDRRESVAHHPLAELTRSALRTVAFEWRHEDWFAALKAGFAPVDETEIDRLENEALARGWRGEKWRRRIKLSESEEELGAELEVIRKKIIPPFALLEERLASFRDQPLGTELADALREFWEQAHVEVTLEQWSAPDTAGPSALDGHDAIHATVWEQMNAWLDNLALAFPREPMTVRDWLPVLEAGLANLTVGVIPPALDQVLIGAIDRSRNPDLRLAFVLGLNEGVFPAVPATPLILTDADRDTLGGRGIALGPDLREQLARERYFGYIACTRSAGQLVLTFARADSEGKKLNPSAFVPHLKRLFPDLTTEEFSHAEWSAAEHASELVSPIMAAGGGVPGTENWDALRRLPALAELDRAFHALRNSRMDEAVSPQLAEKLFGPVLKTSVSRLEQFAACPFRFFVHSGLRAEERKVFELDFREQGSFQHDVLQIFHEQLQSQDRRWRDITPAEARERIGRIAAGLMTEYRDGLLRDSARTQFTARVLTRALQDFIEVIIGWMETRYQFDPVAVELDFDEHGKIPAWQLDLKGDRRLLLRGRIDRVDLFRVPDAEEALCVVMDYKSSAKKLDPLLMESGVQLQLLSYLNVLRHWPNPEKLLGVRRLVPAGVFYVNLRAGQASGSSRAVLADADAAHKAAYRHTGRFDLDALSTLDASGEKRGEQFNYRLKKDGTPHANSTEPLTTAAFRGLLEHVESRLREMGERIYSGEARVDPYLKGANTPCEFCDYAAVCRIDPWTHQFRVLRPARGEEAGGE